MPSLVIENRYGTNCYVCDSDATAQAALANYVREYWKEEMGDELPPSRVSQMIERYFESCGESYTVTDTTTYTEQDIPRLNSEFPLTFDDDATVLD